MKYTNAWMPAALLAAFALSPATRAAQSPAPPASQAAPADSTVDTERQLAAARERLETAAHDVAELSSRLGENVSLRFMQRGGPAPRAMLGVQIDARPGSGGAHVMSVSPGGAAAAAGIEADDVITAIDGEDLAKAPDPGRALVERMRELRP